MHSLRVAFTCLLTLSVLQIPAMAQTYNAPSAIVGPRSFGMGGASIVTVNDISSAYYNPSGLAGLEKTTYSINANIYSFNDGRISGGMERGGDLVYSSVNSTPTITGGGFKLNGNNKESLSFVILEPIDYAYKSTAYSNIRGNWSYNEINRMDKSIWVGASYGRAITETFNFGISVFFARDKYEDSFYASSGVFHPGLDFGGKTKLKSTKFTNDFLIAIIGTSIKLNDNWKIGTTINFPSWYLDASGNMTELYITPIDGEYIINKSFYYEGGLYNPHPLKIGLGMAYEQNNITLELDLNIYDSARSSDTNKHTFSFLETVDKQKIINVNLGIEYILFEECDQIIPVRLGIYSDRSSAPEFNSDSYIYNYEKIDKIGLTMGIGWYQKNRHFDFGINYSRGSGKSATYPDENGRYAEREAEINAVNIMLGASYIF